MSVGDKVEVRPPHKRRAVKGTVTQLVENGFFYRDIDQREHYAHASWLVIPKKKRNTKNKEEK